MVETLTRLSKISAARVEFGRQGMLHNDVQTAARLQLGDPDVVDKQTLREAAFAAAQEAQGVDDAYEHISIGRRQGTDPEYSSIAPAHPLTSVTDGIRLDDLARELDRPQLHYELRTFLHSRLYPDIPDDAEVHAEDLPYISRKAKIGIHTNASVVFHAPSDLAGPHGMRREIIHCTPLWYKKHPRYDTVLVTVNPDVWGMSRFRVARMSRLISFASDDIYYHAAIVEWFRTDGDAPDPLTGMWIVRPYTVNGRRDTSIIPLAAIARSCHLLPVLLETFIPAHFDFVDTLDAFEAYYVNPYIDYHSHEMII